MQCTLCWGYLSTGVVPGDCFWSAGTALPGARARAGVVAGEVSFGSAPVIA